MKLVLFCCLFAIVGSDKEAPKAVNMEESALLDGISMAARSGPVESLRHFVRDMKNIASGFLANRLDRLRVSRQKMQDRANQWFRKFFKSDKSLK